MSTRSPDPFAGPLEMVTASRIARLFYLDGWTKVQIADELGLTRFKVARLLELARASGMVRISVVGAGSLDLVLSERLYHQFGLRHAVVVNTTTGDDQEIRNQIGAAAADLLTEITTPEDVLGIGWARVVLAMAAKLRGLRAKRIVQLTGALTRADVEATSVDIVRSIARDAKAEASVFYAPMIVSDEQTARGLYRQDAVAKAVTQFDTVTKAVVSVGGWNPPSWRPCTTPSPVASKRSCARPACRRTFPACYSTRGVTPSTPFSPAASSPSAHPNCETSRRSSVSPTDSTKSPPPGQHPRRISQRPRHPQ